MRLALISGLGGYLCFLVSYPDSISRLLSSSAVRSLRTYSLIPSDKYSQSAFPLTLCHSRPIGDSRQCLVIILVRNVLRDGITTMGYSHRRCSLPVAPTHRTSFCHRRLCRVEGLVPPRKAGREERDEIRYPICRSYWPESKA